MSATLNTPEQLATPTDLDSQEVARLTEALNGLAADAVALYLKTKNYHWHLSGSHFRDYHLLFDEQAESVLASVDILAERVRKLGGTTLRSVSHASRLQTVQDDDSDYVSTLDMLTNLMADNQTVAKRMRDAHRVADAARDAGTAGVLENLIDEIERHTWFLFEAAQGGQQTA